MNELETDLNTDAEKKEIYNKAIDDVLKEAKRYGLISTELGFCILQQYISKEIDEDKLWEKFDEMAQNELFMAVDDIRQQITD